MRTRYAYLTFTCLLRYHGLRSLCCHHSVTHARCRLHVCLRCGWLPAHTFCDLHTYTFIPRTFTTVTDSYTCAWWTPAAPHHTAPHVHLRSTHTPLVYHRSLFTPFLPTLRFLHSHPLHTHYILTVRATSRFTHRLNDFRWIWFIYVGCSCLLPRSIPHTWCYVVVTPHLSTPASSPPPVVTDCRSVSRYTAVDSACRCVCVTLCLEGYHAHTHTRLHTPHAGPPTRHCTPHHYARFIPPPHYAAHPHTPALHHHRILWYISFVDYRTLRTHLRLFTHAARVNTLTTRLPVTFVAHHTSHTYLHHPPTPPHTAPHRVCIYRYYITPPAPLPAVVPR